MIIKEIVTDLIFYNKFWTSYPEESQTSSYDTQEAQLYMQVNLDKKKIGNQNVKFDICTYKSADVQCIRDQNT